MARRWTLWTGVVVAVIVLFLVTASSLTAGQLSGAIFSTLKDGSRVNANVYASKAEVYLDGGPGPNAPVKAAGLPAGDYYFQVTDPSGKVLLSHDPVTSRRFHVNAAGVIDGVSNHASGIDCDHGALTVQLMPYSDTPNPGGEYKVWATPVGKLVAGGPNFGFTNRWSKTDSYKVLKGTEPFPQPGAGAITIVAPPAITVDQNLTGGTSGDETPLLHAWLLSATATDTMDPNPVITVTVNGASAGSDYVFPVGTTTVTFMATGASGAATGMSTVTVVTPP